MIDQEHQKKTRWFKKRYVPLALLIAFVLWGLWPMLVPQWDQDRCSFGEVTNERYWQMRKEVKKDVASVLSEIRASYSMEPVEFLNEHPQDLNVITKWFPKYTEIKLKHSGNDTKLWLIRNVIISKLISKYTQKTNNNNDENIALIHAIIREMGGWFTYSEYSSEKNIALYGYVIHSGVVQNTLSGLFDSLFNRYANIYIHLSTSDGSNHSHLRNLTFLIQSGFFKNLHNYFRTPKSRGCPSSASFTNDLYRKEFKNGRAY